MIRKIAASDLRLGMYIHELGRSRINDASWTAHIERELRDETVLQRIQQSTREVWIDTCLGISPEHIDTPVPNEPPPVVRFTDTRPVSMEEELNRARLICGRAKKAVMNMFSDARMGRAMNAADVDLLVEEISTSVMRHPHALISLSRLKISDEYTYMHSVAVCALMVATARQMKLDEDQVREAGVAGLMHDVGKMAISHKILNKPDRLTLDEYAEMKNHPQAGYEILRGNEQITAGVMDVCLHHHEKYDGSGYPHGLKGEEISLLARMASICDVYDAVTSDRCYKKAWDAARSLREMASWKGHFDETIFQHFVKTVGIYPVGTLVRLKSDRLGVVIEQGEKSLLHPKVKVFMSARTRIRFAPKVIQLGHPDEEDAIVRFEQVDDWMVGDIDALWGGTPD